MFCGHPYIDCRASINSLIPADLPDKLALKLVNIYMNKLINEPQLHDKVELEVVFTIWVPDFKEEFQNRFPDHNLTSSELELLDVSLKKITSKGFKRLRNDISSVETLVYRFKKLRKDKCSPIHKIYQLFEDCRIFGTLAFAHAARAGFVSITYLNSLVKQNILTEERMLEFQRSIPTVATEFQDDLAKKSNTVEDLISTYGHLRPGTYDINQIAYWENPDFYFKRPKIKESKSEIFKFSKSELTKIKKSIQEISNDLKSENVVEFLGEAIQAREKVKFEFSRNISLALDMLASFGKDISLSREEISFLDFSDISKLRIGNLNHEELSDLITLRKASSVKQKTKLPAFISDQDDFTSFEIEKMLPNFVTTEIITAELLLLTTENNQILDNKIVVIESAASESCTNIKGNAWRVTLPDGNYEPSWMQENMAMPFEEAMTNALAEAEYGTVNDDGTFTAPTPPTTTPCPLTFVIDRTSGKSIFTGSSVYTIRFNVDIDGNLSMTENIQL